MRWLLSHRAGLPVDRRPADAGRGAGVGPDDRRPGRPATGVGAGHRHTGTTPSPSAGWWVRWLRRITGRKPGSASLPRRSPVPSGSTSGSELPAAEEERW